MALLQIRELTIAFGGILALGGVDLNLGPQEILGIIGPNGSGKTTLFNCISGLYRPKKGSILFEGRELLGLLPSEVGALGIARTFQNLRLFMHMTVLDNLMLGRHVKFKKNPFFAFLRIRQEELRHRDMVEELIEFLDLQAFRNSRVSDCPYGVQKRVEVGRAMAMEPRLLMLDEPIAGLTSEEREEMAYRITEIRGRFRPAILLVEHDLKIASRLADRMVAFDHGMVIAQGTPEEVQKNPQVIRAYLGED